MSSTGDHSWSDIPTEILTSVAERVLTGDHTTKDLIFFGSVCKAWRQASFNVRVRRSISMPWLINVQFVTYMDGRLNLIKCDLSDFWYKQSYWFAQALTLPRTCCYVRASKNGWLLIWDECHGNDKASILFFFYNPFRNMIIGLPMFTIEADLEIKVSRFTTSPTSPNGCDIFVICGKPGPDSGGICRIYTCNVKDEKWICQNITGQEKELRDVLYMNGAFYCVFSVGLSVVMDIFTFGSEFRTEEADDGVEQCGPFVSSSSSSSSNSLIRNEKDELYLVEADGKLLLAVYSLDDTGNYCHIYQFDGSEKEWTRVKSLGNQVMILSSKVKVGSIVVPAVLDAEQFANMIFVLGSSSTYDSYVCKETEGTWKFDKSHDLISPESCNIRIEPPTLWHYTSLQPSMYVMVAFSIIDIHV